MHHSDRGRASERFSCPGKCLAEVADEDVERGDRPMRVDGWFLMITDSPVAHAARALTLRQFYAADGMHVATMAQEAVVRRERPQLER